MRDAEIERLLGGYATNTLTNAERQALFAAALDDQELFNALEDEHALRELLEDGTSRRMIAEALAAREPVRLVPWFLRPWAWGGLAAATAGLGIGFVLLTPHRKVANQVAMERLDRPATEPRAALPPEQPAAIPKPQKRVGRMSDRPTLAPPPAMKSEAVQEQPVPPPVDAPIPAPASPTMMAGSGFRAVAEAQQSQQAVPVIGYTVLRRGAGDTFAQVSAAEELHAGDSVKLRVEAPVSGSLQVLEQDAAGSWNPVYPASGGLAMMARQQVTIPDAPIPLGLGKHLRLVFTSASPVATMLTTGAVQALARPKERYTDRLSETSPTKASPAAPGAKSVATLAPGVITTDIILTPRQP